MQSGQETGVQVDPTPATIVSAFHNCELSLYEARYAMLRNDPGAVDVNDDLLFMTDFAA